MKMVITLKSGVQLRFDVDDFTTGLTPVGGEIRSLKWTRSGDSTNSLNWINTGEIAAIHGEDMSLLEADDE